MKTFYCAICGIFLEGENSTNDKERQEFIRDETKLCTRCSKNCGESD